MPTGGTGSLLLLALPLILLVFLMWSQRRRMREQERPALVGKRLQAARVGGERGGVDARGHKDRNLLTETSR